MYTIVFLLLSLVPVVTSYVNDFDQPVLFQCPKGKSISYWESYHSNHFEDRRHRFSCQRTRQLRRRGCRWHGEVNHFDQQISFQCPNNGIISGVSSYHSNHHEDRRYKFYCCPLKRRRNLVNCQRTGYVNPWDGELKFRVPTGHVLKGVFSIHQNHYEDRRFDFETCVIRRGSGRSV